MCLVLRNKTVYTQKSYDAMINIKFSYLLHGHIEIHNQYIKISALHNLKWLSDEINNLLS